MTDKIRVLGRDRIVHRKGGRNCIMMSVTEAKRLEEKLAGKQGSKGKKPKQVGGMLLSPDLLERVWNAYKMNRPNWQSNAIYLNDRAFESQSDETQKQIWKTEIYNDAAVANAIQDIQNSKDSQDNKQQSMERLVYTNLQNRIAEMKQQAQYPPQANFGNSLYGQPNQHPITYAPPAQVLPEEVYKFMNNQNLLPKKVN